MSNEIFDFTNFNDENKKGRKAEIYDNSKSFWMKEIFPKVSHNFLWSMFY